MQPNKTFKGLDERKVGGKKSIETKTEEIKSLLIVFKDMGEICKYTCIAFFLMMEEVPYKT